MYLLAKITSKFFDSLFGDYLWQDRAKTSYWFYTPQSYSLILFNIFSEQKPCLQKPSHWDISQTQDFLNILYVKTIFPPYKHK
jgi:hypothetical protein